MSGIHPRFNTRSQDPRRALLQDLDSIEADCASLQSRVWSVRQRLQQQWGIKEGFQYEEANGTSVPLRPTGDTL